MCNETIIQEVGYYEAIYPFPICNHVKEWNVNNYGYAQGIMSNGIPFEAELWANDNCINVSFVLPRLFLSMGNRQTLKRGNIIGFHTSEERYNQGILTIGMVDDGFIESYDELLQYVDVLKEQGLIEYLGQIENAAGLLCTDVEGNELVNIIVTLEEDEEELAEVYLEFREFPCFGKKSTIRVLKGGR